MLTFNIYHNVVKVEATHKEEFQYINYVCTIQHRYNKKIIGTDHLFNKYEKSFPTGFLDLCINKLKKMESNSKYYLDGKPSIVQVKVFDHRIYKTNTLSTLRANIPVEKINRRYNQERVFQILKEHSVGYLSSTTASGKSRYIIDAIDIKKVFTLVVVPTQTLRRQIHQELGEIFGTARVSDSLKSFDKQKSFKEKRKFQHKAQKSLVKRGVDRFGDPISDNTGLSPEEELLAKKGYIQSGGKFIKVAKSENSKSKIDKSKYPEILVICSESIDSLPVEYLDIVEMIILDEGHRGSTETNRELLKNTPNAMYRYCISATPWRDRKEDVLLLVSSFGTKILYDEPASESIKNGIVKSVTYEQKSVPYPSIGGMTIFIKNETDPNKVISLGIVCNESRNETIINDAIDLVENKGRTVLICLAEASHGEVFIKRFAGMGYEVYLYHSKIGKAEKLEIEAKIKEKNQKRIYIATEALKEGIDSVGINGIILGDVRKASNRVIQFTGRGLRLEEKFKDVLVIDYMDSFNELTKKWAKERKKIFKDYYNENSDETFFFKKMKKAGVKMEKI